MRTIDFHIDRLLMHSLRAAQSFYQWMIALVGMFTWPPTAIKSIIKEVRGMKDELQGMKSDVDEIRGLIHSLRDDIMDWITKHELIRSKCEFRGLEMNEDRVDRDCWRSSDEAGAVQARWDARKLERLTRQARAQARAVRL